MRPETFKTKTDTGKNGSRDESRLETETKPRDSNTGIRGD